MDRILVRGGHPLNGDIHISGAKNAALPLMVATLLTDESLELANIPHLVDISQMAKLLAQFGVELNINGNPKAGSEDGRLLTLTTRNVTSTEAPYDIVRKMRASFLVFGPLLARAGQARVSLPGGCAIGARPVDLHLKALEAMGAEIVLEEGYVSAKAPYGLTGARVAFPFVSVGATENALMAASLARGETVLENVAREPEISDLAECLIAMGAQIEGHGTSTIHVQGQDRLHAAHHRVLPDRIETGTYAMAPAMAGGSVFLKGARVDLIGALLPVLRQAGIHVEETEDGLFVSDKGGRHKAVDIETEPYPGFPTDLQAQFMALMSTAIGTSHIKEVIFENRFMHVPELTRMGADITVDGQMAHVKGVDHLKGAQVMATDLRASVSLVLAAMAAEGETVVNRVYHLDRGFERIEEKLGACGASIERIKE